MAQNPGESPKGVETTVTDTEVLKCLGVENP